MARKTLYRLNDQELEIIRMAREGNPDPFTDYYLKGANTGTWWLPGTKTLRWQRGYQALHKAWKAQGKPEDFEFDFKEYRTMWHHENSKDFPTMPAFHQNHGFMLLNFGKELFTDRTPVRTVIGGFGSGKTMQMAITMLVYAAIFEGFRGFGLAPEATQANEVLLIAANVLTGTKFEERFLLNYTRGPNAAMRIGNDMTGVNTIECKPLLKREESLRTVSGDCAMVDQAEKFDDLEAVIREIGTRFRGRVPSSGRERVGTLTLVANSDYNDSLWRVAKKGEDEQYAQDYKFWNPSSYDNPYLTERDIARYEAQIGDDEEDRRVYLLGGQPLGNGKEFSKDVLTRMRDERLDAQMKTGLAAKAEGYVRLEQKSIGVHEWLLPYQDGRSYLVISDPGTDNPPNRNSYAILVWDVTEFPGTRDAFKPARLVGFVWGFGKGDIKNWANKHAELTYKYHAISRNGFDATGFQSGYDEWIAVLNNLLSEKINLSGNNKARCLNAAKMLASYGLLKLPLELTGLYNQLQRYELPEPPKLRQDLVMAFIMSCDWLHRLFYMVIPREKRGDQNPYRFLEDRNERPLDIIEDRLDFPY